MPRRWVYIVVLLAYAVAVGVLTLRAVPEIGTPARLLPLSGISYLLTEPGKSTYVQFESIVGNVALFVPLGWLLPMIWAQLRSLRRVLAITAVCSIAIEVAQFAIPGRTPATDDVLLNTLGGIIGAIMFFAPRTGDRIQDNGLR